MPKFLILASETIYYDVEVTAKNEEEVKELIMSGEINLPDPCDSSNFHIEDIQKITKATRCLAGKNLTCHKK